MTVLLTAATRNHPISLKKYRPPEEEMALTDAFIQNINHARKPAGDKLNHGCQEGLLLRIPAFKGLRGSE